MRLNTSRPRRAYIENINLILISQIYLDAPEQRAPAGDNPINLFTETFSRTPLVRFHRCYRSSVVPPPPASSLPIVSLNLMMLRNDPGSS